MCSVDIFLGLLALLFPPLPVWVKRGICSADSIINILLCVLGFLPGLIHAWYIIAKYPEPIYEYEVLDQDAEGGGPVTYVVVHQAMGRSRRQRPAASTHGSHNHRSYGTTNNTAPSPAAAPSAAAASPAEGASSANAGAGARNDNGGEGRSDAPPPSYAQVVAGDNKIQSDD
ncbi:putative protein family UPF0057 [Niveomyces insectorum RCEF 264]|uniref:Stress response RCI peptide n=1 Tax=Niveomyces insectorum RCEF 264 TaxID=1081102 RepID=A0A167YW66_9HYPO|nr:putative protein family UPF0057 [Niveomyces insectorum RCEF 264]